MVKILNSSKPDNLVPKLNTQTKKVITIESMLGEMQQMSQILSLNQMRYSKELVTVIKLILDQNVERETALRDYFALPEEEKFPHKKKSIDVEDTEPDSDEDQDDGEEVSV